VRRVAAGETVFLPSLAGFVLDALDPDLARLTPRERDVLRLIARGYLYKEVGLELGISPKTVEHHVSAVLRKLQLSNRHQLSRWASHRRL
jgi:DNA-binding NarL/FixJ family response regulator